jgi:hypothetical protein
VLSPLTMRGPLLSFAVPSSHGVLPSPPPSSCRRLSSLSLRPQLWSAPPPVAPSFRVTHEMVCCPPLRLHCAVFCSGCGHWMLTPVAMAPLSSVSGRRHAAVVSSEIPPSPRSQGRGWVLCPLRFAALCPLWRRSGVDGSHRVSRRRHAAVHSELPALRPKVSTRHLLPRRASVRLMRWCAGPS